MTYIGLFGALGKGLKEVPVPECFYRFGFVDSRFVAPVLWVKDLGFGVEASACKGTLLGTPNWEPQEYSRYIIGIYLPGSLYSIIFLLYSWGSQFGVPSRVPLACRERVERPFLAPRTCEKGGC